MGNVFGHTGVVRYRAFVGDGGEGNPTLVARPGALDGAQALRLAAATATEVALLSTIVAERPLAVRFFAPGGEMNVCGHALLCALAAAQPAAGKRDMDVRTGVGTLRGSIDGASESATVYVLQPALVERPLPRMHARYARTLGLPEAAVHETLEPTIISTGRAKLVIPLADRRFLANVVMDIAALRALDLGPEVTGVYPVAPGPDGGTWHARQFPIGIGLPEDPGTGIAASAFAGYLARRAKPLDGWFEICIFQGEAMGRRCRVLGAAHVQEGAVDATRFGGRVAVERREAVTIRLATDRDAAGVLACLRDAFAPFENAYTPEAFEDTVLGPELLRKRMAAMSVFVATNQGGAIVGTISCALLGDGEGHLRGMAVNPEWRGRGVAEQLLAAAESELRKRACSRVTLTTTAPLKRAMRFYEKNGFRLSGKTADFFGMPLFEHVKALQ